MSFAWGHMDDYNRWVMLYCYKKGSHKPWYISKTGLIRWKHTIRTDEIKDVKNGVISYLRAEDIEITIPDDMDIIACSTYGLKGYNIYGIGKDTLLEYPCNNIDYSALINALSTLIVMDYDPISKISSLILEEMRNKLGSVNITGTSDLDNVKEILSLLSTFATSYPSYRLIYICIGFTICIRGDIIRDDGEYQRLY